MDSLIPNLPLILPQKLKNSEVKMIIFAVILKIIKTYFIPSFDKLSLYKAGEKQS